MLETLGNVCSEASGALVDPLLKSSSRLKDNVQIKKDNIEGLNSGASLFRLYRSPDTPPDSGPKVASLAPVTCQLFTIPPLILGTWPENSGAQLLFDRVCCPCRWDFYITTSSLARWKRTQLVLIYRTTPLRPSTLDLKVGNRLTRGCTCLVTLKREILCSCSFVCM